MAIYYQLLWYSGNTAILLGLAPLVIYRILQVQIWGWFTLGLIKHFRLLVP